MKRTVPTECLDIKDIKGNYIYEEDIVTFNLVENDNLESPDPITLIGVFVYNQTELRYEIDIYSKDHPEYHCLYYNYETMSNFEIIGNINDNKDLIEYE